MIWRVARSTIQGEADVPGDKGIAHRALMLAALAEGRSRIENMPSGEAVGATLQCLRQLRVSIEDSDSTTVVAGTGRLSHPEHDLYAGNSGTTMRLLTAVLAAQSFSCRFTGDPFLSRRPMSRIVEPLSLMGASIRSRGGRPPLEIEGRPLKGVRYRLPVASAQVKSSILLAGLLAQGETVVCEPLKTRDHTERLLKGLHVDIKLDNRTVTVRGPQRPSAFNLRLPGDCSSAAFLFTAAALTGGTAMVRNVGINPGRASFLKVLEEMGINVEVFAKPDELGEPVADVAVEGQPRHPIHLTASDIPSLVDELPLIVLLATQAQGTSTITGAQELRVKESDRISGVARILRSFGAHLDELPDGFIVTGPTSLRGAHVESQNDHRLAMTAAVAGAVASGETCIEGAEAASVSFPEFVNQFHSLGAQIDVA